MATKRQAQCVTTSFAYKHVHIRARFCTQFPHTRCVHTSLCSRSYTHACKGSTARIPNVSSPTRRIQAAVVQHPCPDNRDEPRCYPVACLILVDGACCLPLMYERVPAANAATLDSRLPARMTNKSRHCCLSSVIHCHVLFLSSGVLALPSRPPFSR